jgi:hypothetical protein
MHPRTFTLSVVAAILGTSAFAQEPFASFATFDASAYSDKSPAVAQMVSYKIPAAKPGETDYAIATPPSAVRTMPAYRVNEFRPEVFRDRDVYTKVGMAAVSFQRHPGLVLGNPFKLNEALAYQTFLRDDWNSTKSDYFDMAHAMALGGDAGEGRMIVKAINDEDVRMRAESQDAAAAPAIGRFQIASEQTGTRLLELPEETINFSLIKKTW